MRFQLIAWFFCIVSYGGVLSAQSDAFAMQRALQRYTEAYGGERDADALSSISIEGFQIQGGETYSFLMRKKRPDMIRYRLSLGDSSVVAAYNGKIAWMQTNVAGTETTRALTKEEMSALKAEATFESPLFRHLEKRSNTIEMIGRAHVERGEAFVFEVEDSIGVRSRYYLDMRAPHILKRERLGEDDAVTMTTYYRDYREVDGFPFAFEIENRDGDEVLSLVKVDSITVNPGLLSFYFEMPE